MEKYLADMKKYLETTKIGIVNLKRQKELLTAYEILKRDLINEDEENTIELVHGALQDGSVSIRITAIDFTAYDMNAFYQVIKNASNFQIYPTADDRIRLDVMFEDVIDYYVA